MDPSTAEGSAEWVDVSGDGGVLKKVRCAATFRSKELCGLAFFLLLKSSNTGRLFCVFSRFAACTAHSLWQLSLSFSLAPYLSVLVPPSGASVRPYATERVWVSLRCPSLQVEISRTTSRRRSAQRWREFLRECCRLLHTATTSSAQTPQMKAKSLPLCFARATATSQAIVRLKPTTLSLRRSAPPPRNKEPVYRFWKTSGTHRRISSCSAEILQTCVIFWACLIRE